MKRSIDVTLRTPCPKCQKEMSVNGLFMQVPCWNCNDLLEIGVAGWQQLLAGPLAGRSGLELESTDEVVVQIGRHALTVADGVWAPFCPECTEPLDIARTFAAGADACVCTSADCGAHISLVTPSRELRALLPDWITHLVETPVAHTRTGGNAIAYDCPRCQGALPLGTGQIAKCEYCGTEARLPIPEDAKDGPLGALQLVYDA